MKILFFSHLRDAVGTGEIEHAPRGTTVADLLDELYAQYPKLRAWDASLLIGAGVEFVGRDYILLPNEEIALMPPVQGG